jgi:hypothetical protein
MRKLRVKSEVIRNHLDVLASKKSSPADYQASMKALGSQLGFEITKFVGRNRQGLLICTPEDADFVAAGLLESLRSHVKRLNFACFWHRRAHPDLNPRNKLSFDVAPVVKRYEEPTRKSLDFIVVVKSIISSGCVVRHNVLDIIDRKEPAEIFVAAPVIYKDADKCLKAEFPASISRKFHFVYFAEDSKRDAHGIVSPGIGGDVYKRLGLSKERQSVPEIVKRRRADLEKTTSARGAAAGGAPRNMPTWHLPKPVAVA